MSASGSPLGPPRPRAPRAKIVCTLGPACDSAAGVQALAEAGMNVARLNFSHGTHAEHRARIDWVRAAEAAVARPIAVLADLQGPKIRLGTFAGGHTTLADGADFTITTEVVEGDAARASTTYGELPKDVAPGDSLLLDDGAIRLEVLATDGVRVRCRVVEGGPISDHKGINLPGVRVRAPALTDKDREDLAFALAAGADLVALSFVRAPDDAAAVRAAMDAAGRHVPVLAKIEKPEAVDRLEEIVAAFDGLMVARGDLGVELPLERVPLVQKRAIRLARAAAKPVIVATQMLESMIEHSRPTRAEASDVANAVLDGADALMLSGETSVGRDPAAVVRTMRRIIVAAEQLPAASLPAGDAAATVSATVARAAVEAGRALGVCALVAYTRIGATARQVAAHRAPVPILAFTHDPEVVRQLALTWGVEPKQMLDVRTTDWFVQQVDREVPACGLGGPGELVVLVAGMPSGTPGSTNFMRVHRLGSG